MNSDLERRIALLASDRESGASEILDEAIDILRGTLAHGADVVDVARALCRAQPSLASIWNAAMTAVAAVDDPARFDQFVQRVSRAPDALVRFAREAFDVDLPPEGGSHTVEDVASGFSRKGPLRLVTVSFSRSVETVLRALAAARPVRVACAEGRPALEGRRLAVRLSEQGIAVTCFSDAAIGHALGAAEAVIVGADAVAPEWFLNKSGTRMLATAAAQQGVPVYVVATRDKFVDRALAAVLRVREGEASEIWDGAPAGVAVRNPYFEHTPLDLVTSVISDVGLLGVGMVPEVCESTARDLPPGFLQSTGLSR